MKFLTPAIGVFLVSVLILFVGCGERFDGTRSAFNAVPELVRVHEIGAPDSTLKPVRLQLVRDTLFVSYNGTTRIDKLSPDMEIVGSIDLSIPAPVHPTDFAIADSMLVVVDHARHLLAIYDRQGRLMASFGTQPDGATQLMPFSLDVYGGVAYIGDIASRSVLAVSLVDAEGVTEMGELILSIPSDPSQRLDLASAVMVTFDGRLLVGEAASGSVEVFTCDGRHVYSFDTVSLESSLAPQGFAFDDVSDPALQDTTSFDPSGVRQMGRIHVVDANNRQVHMFNPLGNYVASYASADSTGRPAGIAVDAGRNLIYIADPVAGHIAVYRYQE